MATLLSHCSTQSRGHDRACYSPTHTSIRPPTTIHPSNHPPTHPPILPPPTHTSIHLSNQPPAIHPASTHPSIHPSTHPLTQPPAHPSIYSLPIRSSIIHPSTPTIHPLLDSLSTDSWSIHTWPGSALREGTQRRKQTQLHGGDTLRESLKPFLEGPSELVSARDAETRAGGELG